VAATATERTRAASLASRLAAQKLEQVRGLAWGYGLDGTPRQDVSTSLAVASGSAGGGTGLAMSPPGSLEADTAGFVDYLDRSGRWLGAGSRPPEGTGFIRRWAIEPDALNPGDSLVVRVRVLQRHPAPPGGRSPSDRVAAEISLVRTRRPW